MSDCQMLSHLVGWIITPSPSKIFLKKFKHYLTPEKKIFTYKIFLLAAMIIYLVWRMQNTIKLRVYPAAASYDIANAGAPPYR